MVLMFYLFTKICYLCIIIMIVYHMKKKGSKFEYEAERNKNILEAFRHEIITHKHSDILSIFNSIVNKPSQRFWVSPERASVVINRMIHGDKLTGMNPNKREMYEEIFRRVKKMQHNNPDIPIRIMVSTIVEDVAPKFYLTAESAKVIFYRALKANRAKIECEKKKKRLQKL